MKKSALLLLCIYFCIFKIAYADYTSDEKFFIIGRALSFAYTLDSISDFCGESTDSRDKFNTLKIIVKDTLDEDLYKVEDMMNREYGLNFRAELKIETTNHIKKIGGCASKNYYEWLVKPQKAFTESLVIIVNMK